MQNFLIVLVWIFGKVHSWNENEISPANHSLSNFLTNQSLRDTIHAQLTALFPESFTSIESANGTNSSSIQYLNFVMNMMEKLNNSTAVYGHSFAQSQIDYLEASYPKLFQDVILSEKY